MKWSDECDGIKSRAHTNVLIPGTYCIKKSADRYEAVLFLHAGFVDGGDRHIPNSLGYFDTFDDAKDACERDKAALTVTQEAGDIYVVDASQMRVEQYEQFKRVFRDAAASSEEETS